MRKLRWIVLLFCVIIFLIIAENVWDKEIMMGDIVGYKFISTYLISDFTIPIAKIITQFGGVIILVTASILSLIIIKQKKVGIAICLNLLFCIRSLRSYFSCRHTAIQAMIHILRQSCPTLEANCLFTQCPVYGVIDPTDLHYGISHVVNAVVALLEFKDHTSLIFDLYRTDNIGNGMIIGIPCIRSAFVFLLADILTLNRNYFTDPLSTEIQPWL